MIDGFRWLLEDLPEVIWAAIGAFVLTLIIGLILWFLILPVFSENGIASVYSYGPGTPHHGVTACGTLFDPAKMTAAHRTLPCGTTVVVRHGSYSAIVRIVDRGPWRKGRIIDLTPVAAQALHIDGLGPVTVQKVGASK